MKPLTKRQAILVTLTARGLGCKEIAREMGIAVNTARVMLQQARERTECRNAAHLVALALSKGWIPPLPVLLTGLVLALAAGGGGDDQLRNTARIRIQRTQQVRREV
ncbi:sigma factor-like helix-turn-helix DNA-binding protein [Billgrantia bachuensis]|uniref:Helix-turn-helix transcriptional regulator n=1 Tax=Billgrantia bachuensis TaxID=2717286 RepID=A0ABX0PSZ4_9GAMM|nr:helix-turn-helix transcriptional regulator [Halomonas bachuensis]NIC05228.1 helix-turn-helix transcriptional regulator [Halomonas bachuensis]